MWYGSPEGPGAWRVSQQVGEVHPGPGLGPCDSRRVMVGAALLACRWCSCGVAGVVVIRIRATFHWALILCLSLADNFAIGQRKRLRVRVTCPKQLS